MSPGKMLGSNGTESEISPASTPGTNNLPQFFAFVPDCASGYADI